MAQVAMAHVAMDRIAKLILAVCVAVLAVLPISALSTSGTADSTLVLAERHSVTAFEGAFREAFAGGSLEPALTLFFWHNVRDVDRRRVEILISRDLEKKLLRTVWLPPGPAGPFESDGKLMQSNLVVTARLAAEFESDDGSRSLSLHDLGVHEGRYYIVLGEPVPTSAQR
jgi:hypothetical protein